MINSKVVLNPISLCIIFQQNFFFYIELKRKGEYPNIVKEIPYLYFPLYLCKMELFSLNFLSYSYLMKTNCLF